MSPIDSIELLIISISIRHCEPVDVFMKKSLTQTLQSSCLLKVPHGKKRIYAQHRCILETLFHILFSFQSYCSAALHCTKTSCIKEVHLYSFHLSKWICSLSSCHHYSQVKKAFVTVNVNIRRLLVVPIVQLGEFSKMKETFQHYLHSD